MTVIDARGRTWDITRSMNLLAWRPRKRDTSDLLDGSGLESIGAPDDLTGLALGIVLAILIGVLLVVLFPVLLLLLEVALVFALLAPVLLALVVLGVRRHTVRASCRDTGETQIRENVRFLWNSRAIMRDWRRQLESTGQIST
jgi:hypothetical protein